MIRVENIRYGIGSFRLEVSLDVGNEDYFVLAGHTGCGKTTLMECLCGLRQPSSGRILVDGADVASRDPRQRQIGYVPQDNALFDHLNVRDNVLFALHVRGASKAEKEKTIGGLADRISIGHLLDRPIPGLSGGERQRVALARALAMRPRALLLDEPVSALDESLRDKVCRELVGIQRDLRVPVIHVCHSSEEARLVATRMAVMRDGRIEQVAPPETMFDRPRNAYVATFLRTDNIFAGTGTVVDGVSFLRVHGVLVRAEAPQADVAFVVRPWQIRVGAPSGARGENVVRGTVAEFSCVGSLARVRLDGPLPLAAHLARQEAARLGLARGQRVEMSFGPDAVCVLEREPSGPEGRPA